MPNVTNTFFISFASRSRYSNRHQGQSVVPGPDGRVTVTISDIVEETRDRGLFRADNRDIKILHGTAIERINHLLDIIHKPHARYMLYFEINLGHEQTDRVGPDGWGLLDGLDGHYYLITPDDLPFSVTVDGLPQGTRFRPVLLRWVGLDVIETIKVSLTCTSHEE